MLVLKAKEPAVTLIRFLLPAAASVGAAFAAPACRAELITFSFGGQITNLPDHSAGFPSPPPFIGINVGDAWSLSYTFESSSFSVDGFPAGTRAFANPLRFAMLTVGASTSSLPLVPVPPPQFGSLFQRGTAVEDVYELQIRMVPQQGSGSPNCGIILTDTDALAVPDPFTLLTTLNLADFESRLFYIQPLFAPLNETYRGSITSFVPAPAGAGVLAAGMLLSARRRR